MVVFVTSKILSVWTVVCLSSAWCQRDGAVFHLTQKDVLLLEADENPKCFTRTQYDFTCFWEETSNKSYSFFYKHDDKEKRCNLTLQRKHKGTVLHVCYFPPSEVFLFTLTHIRVTDPSTNTTVYTRTVSVEDLGLLDPPGGLSLHPTGQAGLLQISWRPPKDWGGGVHYEIQSSSPSLRERTELIRPERPPLHTLASLPPGEVVFVQMRVRPNGDIYSHTKSSGHWSDWSDPVSAMVPQSSEDISLLCHTSDLQNVTCQWNKMADKDLIYILFYKIDSRDKEEDWRECLQDENSTSCCHFLGEESSVILAKLSAGSGPLSQTFYTEPFRLSSSVRTPPPGSLRGESDGGRLDLRWDAPLPALSAHLMYQVRYQPKGEGAWKLVTLQGPETCTSLDVQTGLQYHVQVQARPNGSVYAGYWSNWSHGVSVAVASDIGVILIPCIPFTLLILLVVFFSILFKYFKKLKQYLWPPVPNLNKVLQGFLTEINRQTWDPPYEVKQCFEETSASVVEIMSEKDGPEDRIPPGDSSTLLSPERGSVVGEEMEQSPEMSGKVSLDYVTLKTNDVIPCLAGNDYMYEEGDSESLEVVEEVLLTRGQRLSLSRTSSLSSSSTTTTDILNRSYLPSAELPNRPDLHGARPAGNVYANLEEETTD